MSALWPRYIVFSILCCGRNNPGSNLGHGIVEFFFNRMDNNQSINFKKMDVTNGNVNRSHMFYHRLQSIKSLYL